MNDDQVPELSDEAARFLESHHATGEPPAESLARLQRKIFNPTTRPIAAKRTWLSNELFAAAAVLVVIVAGTATYLAIRSKPTQPDPLEQVGKRYQAGDFEGARREAVERCRSSTAPICSGLADKLTRVAELVSRFDALSREELGELQALDSRLSLGRQTPLQRKILQRLRQLDHTLKTSSLTIEQLITEARARIKDQNLAGAIDILEECLERESANLSCLRLIASTNSRMAARDNDADALKRAKKYYENYLQVAPPEDPYVPKIKEILTGAFQ